jgi:tRNA(fMet)-specific endonuclease VapC
MILVDTDHLTVLRYAEHPRCVALEARLRSAGEPITTTVITVEEQMRGWLSDLGRKRDVRTQLPVYENLARLIESLGRWRIVRFEARAAEEFERLRKLHVRIGTPDLKIAAIALVQGALLLSANLRDFRKVPRLRVENWLE